HTAATGGRHAVAHQSREAKRPLEVDPYHLVKQGLGNIGGGGGDRRHAGVVDQHIHLAKLGVGSVHQAVDLVPVADMAAVGEGFAAEGAHFAGGFLAVFHLAAGDHHIGAAHRKSLDHLVAEAAAAAGDQHHFAGKVE